jgi:hypothetical protein
MLEANDESDRADLRVQIIRDLDKLESHAAAWNTLALAALQCLPQLSHAWVAPYLAHRFKPGETWRCALDGTDGTRSHNGVDFAAAAL